MFTFRRILPTARRTTHSLFYSTTPPSTPDNPPFLVTIKSDLKTAMRAKDTPRLSVLRSILSATLNASKTTTPITTDVQLIGLLQKTAAAGEEAARQFMEAGRMDLVAKELKQVDVLRGYIQGSGVGVVEEGELEKVVKRVVEGIKKEEGAATRKNVVGEAMKRVNKELEGKVVVKRDIADLVKKLVA